MQFSLVATLAVVAVLPFAHAIFILTSGTTAAATTATTVGLTVGTGGTAAAAAVALGAAAVVGALVVGGLAAAAANNRHKRSTASICLPTNNPDIFLTLAANSDQLGCGLRLVCELEATPDEALTQEERLILNLFGRTVKPVTFSEMKSAKSGFQYAALVGSQANSPSECAKVFDQCPLDRQAIMGAFYATK
ncbi:hypothetical protein Pmani_028458 [Petrolisthes manimaculis]|uniref:Uncharacterized protein n=1 Tax=Petrolisthes manimaculis TaxID=1843537 RepID=A0AAE1P238_9EUCA|nr:hypothetical protein Pmani_028458 [Petrolisthes manimaculis]